VEFYQQLGFEAEPEGIRYGVVFLTLSYTASHRCSIDLDMSCRGMFWYPHLWPWGLVIMLPACTSFLSCCWPSCDKSCSDILPHRHAEWTSQQALGNSLRVAWTELVSGYFQQFAPFDWSWHHCHSRWNCDSAIVVLQSWPLCNFCLWPNYLCRNDSFEHFASDKYLCGSDDTMYCLMQRFKYTSENACMFMTCLWKPL